MKKAFMIMQIGNSDLDKMYGDVYCSIAKECGLDIYRVDRDNEGELIKKTIDRYIEEAEIIIADLTNERPSCYHEVGYAYGLKKYLNVILTIREDHLPTSDNFKREGPKVHFDLNDYPIISWKKEEINKFKKQLIEEIKRRLILIEKKIVSRSALEKKDNESWFKDHSKKALDTFGNLKGKGFIEVKISSDSFVNNFKQDRIKDVINKLKGFRNRLPFAFLIVLNEDPFKWKIFKNEIIKKFVIEELNNTCVYSAIKRDLFFYILTDFIESKDKNGILYTDTRIHTVINLLLFIQAFYNEFNLKDKSVLNIRLNHYNIDKFKLLTTFERELGKEINSFTTSEKNVSSEINIELNEIDSNMVKIVNELLSDFFTVYDASDYLNKNVEDIVSNYMKEQI